MPMKIILFICGIVATLLFQAFICGLIVTVKEAKMKREIKKITDEAISSMRSVLDYSNKLKNGEL